MLRLLGFVFLVVLCVDTAPWGLAIGAVLCVAWLFSTEASPAAFSGSRLFQKSTRVTDADNPCLNAIPLYHAVYCANCDSITDSPHESCSSCGSHSIIAVSRLWHLTVAHELIESAKYKINFTADVREIPANGLSEAINLIVRLADLGGELKVFHIQVDSPEISDAIPEGQKLELVKPVARVANPWPDLRRQAS